MQFLLTLAILPCILIVYLVYLMDKKEKEPIGEIIKAFLMGFIAIIITLAISFVFGIGAADTAGNYIKSFIVAFIEIALVEELSKFLCGYLFLRKNKYYDCLFDGIVYFVSVSLGFAFIENILYCIGGDIVTTIFRALTTVPAHAFFGVFCGYYFALYTKTHKTKYILLSMFMPVLLHGFYDFCLIIGNALFFMIFLLFVIALYIISIIRIVKISKKDEYIKPKVV